MEKKVNHDETVVKVIEQCQVGPPPGSVPSPTSISLSFFDISFLCTPVTCKRIFFYNFPYSTTHFLQKVLPNLKQSLSLTLKHFFPFSSNIVFPPKPQTPHILYSEGDTLTFIVAESTTNLDNLVSDTTKDVTCFHPFVPMLPSSRVLEDGTLLIPPMAIQVTIFPNSGFTICVNFSHVVVDGKGFHHFMKFWASVCGRGYKQNSVPLPCHDRDMIQDPNGLKPFILETVPRERFMSIGHNVPSDNVRRKFVLRRDHVDNLKKSVSAECLRHGIGTFHLSTFVVTCSLFWVCKVKSEEINDDDEELYLCYWLDCRTRNIAEWEIPSTYFGNCVVSGTAASKRSKLVGQNGIFEAAVAIGNKVSEMQCEPYKCTETLKSVFSEFARAGHRMLVTAGSPKLDVYETDFGWGKPKLSEVVHLHSRMLSLSDCSDKEGGIIEVGVVLGRTQMHKFISILQEILAEL